MSTTAEARKMSGGIGIDVNPEIYLYLGQLLEKGGLTNGELVFLLRAFNGLPIRKVSKHDLRRALLKRGADIQSLRKQILMDSDEFELQLAHFMLAVILGEDQERLRHLEKIFFTLCLAIIDGKK